MQTNTNITAKLYNWSIEPSYYSDVWIARGSIIDDTKGRFGDHTIVRTSFITSIDFENRIVYTLNSVYKLLFPNEIPEEKDSD